MISMLRIDERLIHGQVAVAWTKSLRITHIVVINDEISKIEMQKQILKMAAPPNVKVAIKDIEGGLQLLKDPRTKDLNILVVVKNVKDAYTIVQKFDDIKVVNIGNCGFFAKEKECKEFSKYVRLTEEDISLLKQINNKIPVEMQITPEFKAVNFEKMMKGE